MDTTTSHHQLMNNDKILATAQLWIGSHETLVEAVHTFLAQLWCSEKGCNDCITCKQITQYQHHGVLWLAPEKLYTREDLEPLFKTITFALAPGKQFFFIIQKADYLSASCANSLLKSLEEPPAGYHFILLAQRQEFILPTIRSRCITQFFTHQLTAIHESIWNLFTQPHALDPTIVLKTLEQSKINERESIELLDRLLAHWINVYKDAVIAENQKQQMHANHIITLLEHAFKQTPMPGSSLIFWKNLLLQVTHQ